MRKIAIATLGCLLFMFGGCAPSMEPAYPTPTFAPPVILSPVPSTSTPQPTSLPTGTPTLSPTPFQPISGTVTINDVFLRSGPGFLNEPYWTFPQGEKVEILGRAPGSSWLYVLTSNNLLGWIKLELVQFEGNFEDLPDVMPEGFTVIKGHVYTFEGNPASHITLTLTPAGGTPADQDAATTDALGRFYFFLPNESRGAWTLEANAYGCESSAVNEACSLVGRFPPSIQINVKESAEIWYNLQLEKP